MVTEAGRADGRGLVLVVEHEEAVAELERLYLTRAGFEVHVVTDPGQAAAAAARLDPVAVVLDLAIPGIDPDDLYARVAAGAERAPIVTVVAATDVTGNGSGAARTPAEGGAARDGTGPAGPRPGGRAGAAAGEMGGIRSRVTRPFSPRVLVAAVDAALRQPADDTALPHVLSTRFLTVDPVTRRVRADGREVELTATEFDLLVFMMRHPGRVYSREQLLATVWPAPSGAGSRTVDVHIAQLRAKLGRESPIRTVRGVGYAADIP